MYDLFQSNIFQNIALFSFLSGRPYAVDIISYPIITITLETHHMQRSHIAKVDLVDDYQFNICIIICRKKNFNII